MPWKGRCGAINRQPRSVIGGLFALQNWHMQCLQQNEGNSSRRGRNEAHTGTMGTWRIRDIVLPKPNREG